MRDTANNSSVVRVAKLDFNDSKNALFRIKWNDIEKDASNPNPYCTLSADANGSTGSKLIFFLNIGASASDYTQYQFSAYATGVTDPGGIDSSPMHTQVTDLGALINALNLLQASDIGIYAARLHAPADYSLDTDDFIDITAFRVGPTFTEVLYKDASEVLVSAYRLGVPADANGKVGAGRIEIVRVVGYANSNSATDCVLTVKQDPTDGGGGEADESDSYLTRYVPDNAITELFDYTDSPPVFKGPLLFEITAATSLAAGAYLEITYRSAEY